MRTGSSDDKLPPVSGPQSAEQAQLESLTEAAWVDVVHQMEEVYSDLIGYQVEIEEKNEALEDAQQFISGVLGSMTDVLIVCDQHGIVQQVNTALETLTGQGAGTLKGRPFAELFTESSRETFSRLRSHSRNPNFQDCEVQLIGADGEVPLSMNGATRTDSRGRGLGMVLIGRPVGELRRAYDQLNRSHAELKLAQQQLIDAEKMASLGRLVAGVAHELNNPISFVYGNVHALMGYSERLKSYLGQLHDASGSPPQALEQLRADLRIDKLMADLPALLDGTMEGAERVRDIVMDLRQFSSGQKEQKTEFDLVHTVQTAVHWVTREATIKLRIGYDLPDKLMVFGHPGQIQQVLINLVQNAMDAFEGVRQPRLELSIREFNDNNGKKTGAGDGDQNAADVRGEYSAAATRVRFCIHDNGPGIAEEHLSRVFEPFFTSKPVGQGTGLGLSLSYGLVAEHGGSLQAANHPDGGALFTLELPLARPGREPG